MRERVRAAAVCVLGLATLAAAIATYAERGYHRPPDAGVALTAVAQPTPLSPAATVRPVTRSARLPAGIPLRVALPAIGVDAAVIPVTVAGGELGVPPDPRTLGWWAAGARPGSARGSVVVVGHVDDWKAGRGALYRLEAAPVGATVTVTTATGPVRYRLVGRRVFDKQSLPAGVFAQTGAPRLVLITCGGPFDRRTRHYTDNIVVYGVPI